MRSAFVYDAVRTPMTRAPWVLPKPIGHPLGASGGRILATLVRMLRERGGRHGVAAICIGVGQGLAVVVENVSR